MNKNVIIGAGLSGRGYLDRLLYLLEGETIFLDRNGSLIWQLRREPSYAVRSGSGWGPLKVDSYTVYTITDERTIASITQAERIFVCVGVDHAAGLLPFLQAALQKRDRRPLDILVAENGTQPSSPSAVLRSGFRIHLSKAVIFCTTLRQRDPLATFSEDLDHLPYDSIALKHELPSYGFVQEAYFSDLLERRVYIYNCISVCIAYLGYERGYMDCAEAANDIEITKKVERIAEVINRCITTMYNVSMQGQTAFSGMVVRKLQNRNIKDIVARNARDVERKLEFEERIRKPLSLMQEQGEYSKELLEALAAALRYSMKTKELSQDWGKLADLYAQGICEERKQVLHRRK